MNKQEFLKSVLNSEFCPPNFEEDYKRFCHYQNLAMDTLREFHRVCEKNGVHYILSDGTLLGAVRNGGKIPWDYDIDVLVPLEDREHLVESLNRDLNSDFYFYCPESDVKCRHYIMRLAPKGYRTEELHVDVFYYIGAPDNEEQRKQLAFRFSQLIDRRYAKLVNAREASYGRIRTYLKLMLKKIKVFRMSLTTEYNEYNSYARLFPLEGSNFVLRADQYGWSTSFNDFQFATYYAEDFKESFLLQTMDGVFRVPVGYDRILRETYGEYMTEPPLRSCLSEMLNSLKKIDYAKTQ